MVDDRPDRVPASAASMSQVLEGSSRRRPRRLISLQEACARRGISVRSYWRDTSQLPPPIKGRGKHLFLEEEVDNLIDQLLASRTAG
jgi:predicted DNA-binding transcriptional regulator AlpA